MNNDKKYFLNGCFPSEWVDVDLRDAKLPEQKEETNTERQHKDLNVLLAELAEIKESFGKIEEKKIMLKHLMSFYTGELAT